MNISTETVLRLAQINKIEALKEASGDFSKVAYLLEKALQGFKVYFGDDNLILPMLSIGAYGVISVASHIVGLEIKRMITTYSDGKVRESADIHRKLLPIFEGHFITANPSPVKYALEKRGLSSASVRLPLMPLTESEAEYITKILENSDK